MLLLVRISFACEGPDDSQEKEKAGLWEVKAPTGSCQGGWKRRKGGQEETGKGQMVEKIGGRRKRERERIER
eukprot:773103-Rhodomonas_salina.2